MSLGIGVGTSFVFPQIPLGGGGPFEYTAIDNSFSMEFDGTSSYMNIDQTVYSSSFSFSFWIKPASVSSDALIGYFLNNSNFIRLDSATSIKFKCAAGPQTTFIESAGNNIVLDSWQNITITRDSSNVVSAFRNGVAFGSTATVSGNFTVNSIGVAYSLAGWFFNGKMDEVAIWTTALSEETIQAIYDTTINNPGKVADLSETPEGPPAAWYRMGD